MLVDGCFWHCCPAHGTMPRANADWWQDKLAANRARDADTDAVLIKAGWLVVRVWEHEDMNEAAQRISRLVSTRRASAGVFPRAQRGTQGR